MTPEQYAEKFLPCDCDRHGGLLKDSSHVPGCPRCYTTNLADAVESAIAEEREGCINIALTGDMAEVSIPEEWKERYEKAAKSGDVVEAVRYEFAAAIRARGKRL